MVQYYKTFQIQLQVKSQYPSFPNKDPFKNTKMCIKYEAFKRNQQ